MYLGAVFESGPCKVGGAMLYCMEAAHVPASLGTQDVSEKML